MLLPNVETVYNEPSQTSCIDALGNQVKLFYSHCPDYMVLTNKYSRTSMLTVEADRILNDLPEWFTKFASTPSVQRTPSLFVNDSGRWTQGQATQSQTQSNGRLTSGNSLERRTSDFIFKPVKGGNPQTDYTEVWLRVSVTTGKEIVTDPAVEEDEWVVLAGMYSSTSDQAHDDTGSEATVREEKTVTQIERKFARICFLASVTEGENGEAN